MVCFKHLTKLRNMLKKGCTGGISFLHCNYLLYLMNKRHAILRMRCQKICIENFYLVGGQRTKIGRASCRERASFWGVRVSFTSTSCRKGQAMRRSEGVEV